MTLRERKYWICEGTVAWASTPDRGDDVYRFYTSVALQEIADFVAEQLPHGFRVGSKSASGKGDKVTMQLISASDKKNKIRVSFLQSSTALGLLGRVSHDNGLVDQIFKFSDDKKAISKWVNGRLEAI